MAATATAYPACPPELGCLLCVCADGRGESEGGEAEAEGEQVPKEDPSFYLRREGEGSVEYGARIFRCCHIWLLKAVFDVFSLLPLLRCGKCCKGHQLAAWSREPASRAGGARCCCRRVFGADIEALLRVESLWKARRPPTPLDLDAILGGGPTAAAATVANGSSAAGGAGGARQENGSAAGVCLRESCRWFGRASGSSLLF